MKTLDNEKDSYIKNKFKKDELISKKADDVFNKFLKGEVNNMEQKVVDFNTTKDKKSKKGKKLLAIAASLMIVFISANVYAVTQGYDNVFFMIKNIGKKEEVNDKSAILSDRDLTISYQYIEIADGLKLQIRSLISKNNEAELVLDVQFSEDAKIHPEQYVVYDITNGKKEVGNQKASKIDKETYQYIEKVKLNSITDDTTKLQLEINNDSNIATLEIDLNKKEIQVVSSLSNSKLEKLSEVELKKVLGRYINFNMCKDYPEIIESSLENKINELKVGVAMGFIYDKYYEEYPNAQDMPYYEADEVHKVIKEMFGEEIKEPITNFDGNFVYNSENNEYEQVHTEPTYSISKLCLEISDIKYKDGIYTITYVYCYDDESYIENPDNDFEDIEQYRTTIKIKLNDDYEYTKYCIVDMDWEEANTEKLNETIITNITDVNDTTDITEIYEEPGAPTKEPEYDSLITELEGMIISYPKSLELEKANEDELGDDYYKEIVMATLKGKLSDNDMFVNTEVEIYRPLFTDMTKEEYIDYIVNATNCEMATNFESSVGEWTVLTDYPEDEMKNEVYIHFEELDDGSLLCYRIDASHVGKSYNDLSVYIEQVMNNMIDCIELKSF